MVNYETDLSVADAEELRKEADEVFDTLRVDAARGEFTLVVVRANQKSRNWLGLSRGYDFVYEKRADGKWHSLEDDKRNEAPPN